MSKYLEESSLQLCWAVLDGMVSLEAVAMVQVARPTQLARATQVWPVGQGGQRWAALVADSKHRHYPQTDRQSSRGRSSVHITSSVVYQVVSQQIFSHHPRHTATTTSNF